MTPGACVLAKPAAAWPAVPWPLSDVTGPLPAEETAPGSVRAEARQALALWDLADAVDVIGLVATELATNAVRASAPMRLAGQAPVIRVCLLTDGFTARVEVWDECAMRRLDVFPVQPGGTWRDVPGSDGLPESERCREQ